jgi:glucuronate isomerase
MNLEMALPKTILYTLNPKDNLVLATRPHCFCEDGIRSKIQFGAAWWFNDHKKGIYENLKTLG